MHRYVVSDPVKARLIERQGKLASRDTIDAGRAALVVVDMQNHFVAPGFPAEVPLSREIVPNINRLARAMRAAGGRSSTARSSPDRRTSTHSSKAAVSTAC
jgi:ureidoacrylate peracid hydrolase